EAGLRRFELDADTEIETRDHGAMTVASSSSCVSPIPIISSRPAKGGGCRRGSRRRRASAGATATQLRGVKSCHRTVPEGATKLRGKRAARLRAAIGGDDHHRNEPPRCCEVYRAPI